MRYKNILTLEFLWILIFITWYLIRNIITKYFLNTYSINAYIWVPKEEKLFTSILLFLLTGLLFSAVLFLIKAIIYKKIIQNRIKWIISSAIIYSVGFILLIISQFNIRWYYENNNIRLFIDLIWRACVIGIEIGIPISIIQLKLMKKNILKNINWIIFSSIEIILSYSIYSILSYYLSIISFCIIVILIILELVPILFIDNKIIEVNTIRTVNKTTLKKSIIIFGYIIWTIYTFISLIGIPIPLYIPVPIEKVNDKFFKELDCPYHDNLRCKPNIEMEKLGCKFISIPNKDQYFGLLDPDAIIAKCMVYENYDSTNYLFGEGCMGWHAIVLIQEKNNQYKILRTLEDLKNEYLPIDSGEKAIGFISAAKGMFALNGYIFIPYLPKYFGGIIEETYSININNGYIVNLFTENYCGCGPHEVYEYREFIDYYGNISEISKENVMFGTGGCVD
jgi:hypothetical protein